MCLILPCMIANLMVTLLSGLAMLVSFDRLLRFVVDNYHDQWVTAGKPTGFFWRPPGKTWWSGFFARNRAYRTWPSSAQDWFRQDAQGQRLLKTIRTWRVVGTVGFVLLVTSFVALLAFLAQKH